MADLDKIKAHLAIKWLDDVDHRRSTTMLRELVAELSRTLVVHQLCIGCGDYAIGPWDRRAETLQLAHDDGWTDDLCADCVEDERANEAER